jgi:CheY-like chemotaxis protein
MPNPPILFVDDDMNILMLFEASFKKSCYPTKVAKNGESAIQFLEQDTPALVVLDIAMPEISGVDVLSYLKSDPRLESVPVIVLTAAPARVDAVIEEKADRVLRKPVTPKNLQEVIFEFITPCDQLQ